MSPFYFSLLSDSLIQDLIAARLVLPNRVTIPLKKNMNVAQLRFPIPRVSLGSELHFEDLLVRRLAQNIEKYRKSEAYPNLFFDTPAM